MTRKPCGPDCLIQRAGDDQPCYLPPLTGQFHQGLVEKLRGAFPVLCDLPECAIPERRKHVVIKHGLVGTPSLRCHGKAGEPAAGGIAERLAAKPWVDERSLALVMLQLDLEILGLAVSPECRLAALPGAVVPLHAPRLVLVPGPLGKGCHPPRSWQPGRGIPEGWRRDQLLLSGETALRPGKSSSQNSVTPRAPGGASPPCRSVSWARSSTRRILPEIVFGRSENSSLRTRL